MQAVRIIFMMKSMRNIIATKIWMRMNMSVCCLTVTMRVPIIVTGMSTE